MQKKDNLYLRNHLGVNSFISDFMDSERWDLDSRAF